MFTAVEKKNDITKESVSVSVRSKRWPNASARRHGAFHFRCVYFKAHGIWRIKAAFYLSQRTSGENQAATRATRPHLRRLCKRGGGNPQPILSHSKISLLIKPPSEPCACRQRPLLGVSTEQALPAFLPVCILWQLALPVVVK